MFVYNKVFYACIIMWTCYWCRSCWPCSRRTCYSRMRWIKLERTTSSCMRKSSFYKITLPLRVGGVWPDHLMILRLGIPCNMSRNWILLLTSTKRFVFHCVSITFPDSAHTNNGGSIPNDSDIAVIFLYVFSTNLALC